MKDSYRALGKRDLEFRTKLEVIEANTQTFVDLVPNLEARVKSLEAELKTS